MRRRVGPLEVFGLRPLGKGLRQCWQAIAGSEHAPPSQWDGTSIAIFKPRISLPLWLGRRRPDRRVWIYLLPNRRRQPPGEGYSVRVTYARDYRGRRLTYDGHLGTDFAVPVGTEVTTTAPGNVIDVRNDMQRGGLKVCIDHGGGVVTSSNHLARALVARGDRVERGDVIGLSGMSSVDGVLFFPWLAPHVHLNVILNGEAVDPFATEGEVPMWRGGNRPIPYRSDVVAPAESTRWNPDAIEESIAGCLDAGLRAELSSIAAPSLRAARLTVERVIQNHSFARFPPLCSPRHERTPLLDLPFRADEYQGAALADEG